MQRSCSKCSVSVLQYYRQASMRDGRCKLFRCRQCGSGLCHDCFSGPRCHSKHGFDLIKLRACPADEAYPHYRPDQVTEPGSATGLCGFCNRERHPLNETLPLPLRFRKIDPGTRWSVFTGRAAKERLFQAHLSCLVPIHNVHGQGDCWWNVALAYHCSRAQICIKCRKPGAAVVCAQAKCPVAVHSACLATEPLELAEQYEMSLFWCKRHCPQESQINLCHLNRYDADGMLVVSAEGIRQAMPPSPSLCVSYWDQPGLSGKWASHGVGRAYPGTWLPVFIRSLIERHSRPGDLVLSNFSGGSGAEAIECKLLGRRSVSTDIEPSVMSQLGQRTHFHVCDAPFTVYEPEFYTADATKYNPRIEECSVQLVLSHPPYWDAIRYGRSRGNISSCKDLEEFLQSMREVAQESKRVLNGTGSIILVVGDTRHYRHCVPVAYSTISVYCRSALRLEKLIVKRQRKCAGTGLMVSKSRNGQFLLLTHELAAVFVGHDRDGALRAGRCEPVHVRSGRMKLSFEAQKAATGTLWILSEPFNLDSCINAVLKYFAWPGCSFSVISDSLIDLAANIKRIGPKAAIPEHFDRISAKREYENGHSSKGAADVVVVLAKDRLPQPVWPAAHLYIIGAVGEDWRFELAVFEWVQGLGQTLREIFYIIPAGYGRCEAEREEFRVLHTTWFALEGAAGVN